jgi:hypothetical protein
LLPWLLSILCRARVVKIFFGHIVCLNDGLNVDHLEDFVRFFNLAAALACLFELLKLLDLFTQVLNSGESGDVIIAFTELAVQLSLSFFFKASFPQLHGITFLLYLHALQRIYDLANMILSHTLVEHDLQVVSQVPGDVCHRVIELDIFVLCTKFSLAAALHLCISLINKL